MSRRVRTRNREKTGYTLSGEYNGQSSYLLVYNPSGQVVVSLSSTRLLRMCRAFVRQFEKGEPCETATAAEQEKESTRSLLEETC